MLIDRVGHGVEIEPEPVVQRYLDILRPCPDGCEAVHDEAGPSIDELGARSPGGEDSLGEEGDAARTKDDVGKVHSQLIGEGVTEVPAGVVRIAVGHGHRLGRCLDDPGKGPLGALVGREFDDVGGVETVCPGHVLELPPHRVRLEGGDLRPEPGHMDRR